MYRTLKVGSVNNRENQGIGRKNKYTWLDVKIIIIMQRNFWKMGMM